MTDRIYSVASAVAAFRKHFDRDVIHGARDYSPEELALLERIEGMAQPELEAGNLASALKMAWTAVQSGEMDQDDLANALWLLYEHALLLGGAIEAERGAILLQYEARIKALEARLAEAEAGDDEPETA